MKVRIFITSLFLLTTITSCLTSLPIEKKPRAEFINKSISKHYFYSPDKTKVLYEETGSKIWAIILSSDFEEVPANVSTFQPVNKYFGKDDKSVFFKDKKMKEVDAATFAWSEKMDLPIDKKHIYLYDNVKVTMQAIPEADPYTYEPFDLKPDKCFLTWYKDKTHYYYNHQLTKIDAKTVSFEIHAIPYDKNYIFLPKLNENTKLMEIEPHKRVGEIKILGKNTLSDEKQIYTYKGCDNTSLTMQYIDINTFKEYKPQVNCGSKSSYWTVDNKVYYYHATFNRNYLMKEADYESFTWIGGSYAKDKNRVYYVAEVMEDADPKTFKMLFTGNLYRCSYGVDKDKVFKYGDRLREYHPDDFKVDKYGRLPDEPSSSYGGYGGGDDDD